MVNRFSSLLSLAMVMLMLPGGGMPWGQAIPAAPPVPACSWDGSGLRSTCKFKHAVSGTPTSVAGNRVIVFTRSTTGGYGDSRAYLKAAVDRLAARYGFTATVSDAPAVFDSVHLADAKVVIMAYGEGDVLPPGANRLALEGFQMDKGWGIIWIHSACAFITSAWPFGRESCVQQFYYGQAPGTKRRVYIDSGTSASPNHGRKNPQSEFLLRDLPGWNGEKALELSDRWFCFKEPARNSEGVNVLFGYDRSSGRPTSGNCPEAADTTETASQNHNLAWTHRMGNGISLYHSLGHEAGVYTNHGNMGDSLLWRYIRYAAKDWCVSGGGEPGCDGPLALRSHADKPETHVLQRNGTLSLSIPGKGPHRVSLADMRGRRVKTDFLRGPGKLDFPGLRRGLYLVSITGEGESRSLRIMVY